MLYQIHLSRISQKSVKPRLQCRRENYKWSTPLRVIKWQICNLVWWRWWMETRYWVEICTLCGVWQISILIKFRFWSNFDFDQISILIKFWFWSNFIFLVKVNFWSPKFLVQIPTLAKLSIVTKIYFHYFQLWVGLITKVNAGKLHAGFIRNNEIVDCPGESKHWREFYKRQSNINDQIDIKCEGNLVFISRVRRGSNASTKKLLEFDSSTLTFFRNFEISIFYWRIFTKKVAKLKFGQK